MKCSKFCSETISKEFTCSNHVHTRGFGNARTFKSNTSIAFKNHTVSKKYYTNTINHVETHSRKYSIELKSINKLEHMESRLKREGHEFKMVAKYFILNLRVI